MKEIKDGGSVTEEGREEMVESSDMLIRKEALGRSRARRGSMNFQEPPLHLCTLETCKSQEFAV